MNRDERAAPQRERTDALHLRRAKARDARFERLPRERQQEKLMVFADHYQIAAAM